MYSYRKVLAIIILFSCVISVYSCAPSPRANALDILKRPAELKAEGERGGVAFCAVILLGEIREDGTRSGEITYSLPDAFAGLKIKTDSGVWEAELYDVSISGTVAERLGAPLAPFLQSNNAISAEIKNSAGDGAQTLITVQTDCGTLEYLIDSKSGLPIFLREKGSSGDVIMEFKISDYKIQKTN